LRDEVDFLRVVYMINEGSLLGCVVFGGIEGGLVLRFVKYRGGMATWLDSWQEVETKSW
jgi:hypothetical protein